MSAIAGFWFRDGRSVEPSPLDRMSSLLAHRGPHGSASWHDGPTGFAARTLQTDTTSDDERPLGRLDGDALVGVADARIDNRADLARDLDLPLPLDQLADIDIILGAYRAWGADSPRRLIGDFAFAIRDRKRHTIFCARDTIGARPFRYHLSDRLFAFASESKALLALPEVPAGIDDIQVAFFLDRFLDDPERTFHRAVRRLPASHFLEVSPAGVRLERYWAPDSGQEVRFGSDDEYAEAFREIFLEAVRCRLPRSRPVGAALSGGLDSSSVVCATRGLTPDELPVHAFSAVFPGLPAEERLWNDESEFIDEVAGLPGIVSHRVRADQVLPLSDYDRVLWHHDGPPLGFNLYMRWSLLSAAADQGLRVFLDGTDGDSVVSKGYERFIDLAEEGDWAGMVREVEALTARNESPRGWFPRQLVYPELDRLARSGRWVRWLQGVNALSRSLDPSWGKLAMRHGIGALLPEAFLERYRGWRSREALAPVPPPLIRPEFARRTGLEERKRELSFNGTAAASSREDHARVLSLPRYQFAMELIDGTASAFGIMHRFPFFDRRLVEFCIAIPPDQKLADGWSRWVQRRAMEGILPPAVQWRVHKANLGYNFVRGMMTEAAGLEADLLDDALLEDFIDMDVLRATHRRFVASEPGLEANADAMALYQAVVLARWLRGVTMESSP